MTTHMGKIKMEIDAALYEKMQNHSTFFLRLYEYFTNDNKGNGIAVSEWQSIDSDLNITFPANNFGKRDIGYCLCIIDEVKNNNNGNGVYTMSFHDASTLVEKDWNVILQNLINRSQDKENKYAFVETLWLLDKQEVDTNVLYKVIKSFNANFQPFLLGLLGKISQCLSINKQKRIKTVIEKCGGRYSIYMHRHISDAIRLCKLHSNCDEWNDNIFQLVDKLFIDELIPNTNPQEYEKSDNGFIQLKRWLNSDNPLNDYSILKQLFPVLSEPTRLSIIMRYFHDIRRGHTLFDVNLIEQFKKNDHDEFIRYRYAIETPNDKIILTVPLLCDTILTCYNSKGNAFQTFDGVLDFAITNCDKAHPLIDFGLDRFLPTCGNGVVYNSLFKGFIDYQLVLRINTDKLTDACLLDSIRCVLDTYATRLTYPVCKYGDGSKLDEELFAKCSKLFIINNKPIKLSCYAYKQYEDKWWIDLNNEEDENDNKVNIINSFLLKNIVADGKKHYIDLNMTSIEVFRKYIQSLPSSFENDGNGEFVVPSYSYTDKNRIVAYQILLIKKYADILRMRILPRKDAYVGEEADVFGFWKEQNPTQLGDKNNPKYQLAFKRYLSKECNETNRRTVESLKKELGIQKYNGSYFEVPYDRANLIRLLHRYYFKGSLNAEDNSSAHKFLTILYVGKYKPYCSPELSKVNNMAIDIPYFWCMGKECFHNNLGSQTLSEIDYWKFYSLYHLIEIIGYPKIHATEAGNEPDPVVRQFIAVTNKVMQKFRRLKCRSCGHIMFTCSRGRFNNHNYYSCINPSCSEYSKEVYLNFCYSCKKGLIDSRDTKRCPNGLYICPTCLACCNDALYERLAQRYELQEEQVPDRIKEKLGHGHNNHGDYFCPKCGKHIAIKNGYYICPTCGRIPINFRT